MVKTTHRSGSDLNPLAEVGSQGILPTDADVCIIGSGITGISTAYHLSKLVTKERNDPVKVVILEARKFCRNGGHITPYGSHGFAALAAQYGAEEANKTFALEHYTSSEIVNLIHKHGLEDATSLIHGGHNTIFHSADDANLAKIDHEAAKAAGANVSHEVLLSENDMREKYGIRFPGARAEGHNIWPMKLVTELYQLANTSSLLDLSLHTLTPVISSSLKRWAFSGAHVIAPTRGQIIAFRADTTIDQISKKPLIVLGGPRHEKETGSSDDSVLNIEVGSELRELLPPLFPGIYEGVEEPEMEGQYVSAGYSGHGMPQAFSCAQVFHLRLLLKWFTLKLRDETGRRPLGFLSVS
ncbi:hypothetical protein DL96DRAFT_1670461 [Flagelloscypha sp. PMI_526]|nr:hypothetical protein DL96DRAFT_1670461 [Flagelloscypha sp. PMI_526]